MNRAWFRKADQLELQAARLDQKADLARTQALKTFLHNEAEGLRQKAQHLRQKGLEMVGQS